MDRYPRNGTDVDRDALKRVLQDKLKFKVDVYNNQTKAEIRRIVKSMATADHSNYDAFIFSILTHGEEGVIYGTDGTISIRELTADFKFSKSLTGKPKIFFFQACQGMCSFCLDFKSHLKTLGATVECSKSQRLRQYCGDNNDNVNDNNSYDGNNNGVDDNDNNR